MNVTGVVGSIEIAVFVPFWVPPRTWGDAPAKMVPPDVVTVCYFSPRPVPSRGQIATAPAVPAA